MPRSSKRRKAVSPGPATFDPVRAAIHSFAVVHQNWASHESAKGAAEALGPLWNVLLHDRFLRFCAERGLQDGKIVLVSERAEVVFGNLAVDWATRYYDPTASWPNVKETIP